MIFQINAKIGRKTGIALSITPFVVCIVAYLITAHIRHLENPQDKVVPTVAKMVDGFKRTAFEKDRKDEYRLLVDTIASGRRFFISIGFLFFAVILGLHMGVMPFFDTLFLRFLLFFDKIPAIALLPIIFIIFGLGEISKIALIVIGVFPRITLDTTLRAKEVHQEQIIKAFTLGATNLEVVYKVIFPQILPKVLDMIRLSFKDIMYYLIVGEALAATAGLGYRIFVVRRYIAMDIIIPYVIWMSVLLFLADALVQFWIRKRYPWLDKE